MLSASGRNMRVGIQGFTLIELIIVVAIVGLLAAIAVPFYTNYRSNTYNATAMTDLKSARMSLEDYFIDTREYP